MWSQHLYVLHEEGYRYADAKQVTVCLLHLHKTRELVSNSVVLGIISKIKIKCLNEGCTWEGKHGEKEEHYQKCKFGIIVCPNGCRKKLIRGDLDGHNARFPASIAVCKYEDLPLGSTKEIEDRDHRLANWVAEWITRGKLKKIQKIWFVLVMVEVNGLCEKKLDIVY